MGVNLVQYKHSSTLTERVKTQHQVCNWTTTLSNIGEWLDRPSLPPSLWSLLDLTDTPTLRSASSHREVEEAKLMSGSGTSGRYTPLVAMASTSRTCSHWLTLCKRNENKQSIVFSTSTQSPKEINKLELGGALDLCSTAYLPKKYCTNSDTVGIIMNIAINKHNGRCG